MPCRLVWFLPLKILLVAINLWESSVHDELKFWSGLSCIALRYIGDCVTRHTWVPLRRCQSIKSTATYVRWLLNNVAMLWSARAYHCVHGTFCLCTLSASAFMHWDIPTSARFLFRNLFMEACFCSFLIKLISFNYFCYAVLPTHLWLMRHPRTCAPTNMVSNSQYALPLQFFPQESAGGKSQLPSPENFMTIVGCFERCTYHVTALGLLKKKERKKERFWLSTVSGLPL